MRRRKASSPSVKLYRFHQFFFGSCNFFVNPKKPHILSSIFQFTGFLPWFSNLEVKGRGPAKVDQVDGWIVQMISLLKILNQIRPSRFWGVYTKLKIFNMTNYKKVVYLDADTIAIKN